MRCVALCTKLRRRRATSLAVASLLGVAGVSCSNDGEQAATSAADAESSEDAAPPTCGPDRVQKTVEAFVRALDSGDVGSADALVVTGPRFIGYGVNPERWGEYDGGRDSLASFFETQVADGYRVELDNFTFDAYQPETRGSGFAFSLNQRSDSQGATTASGKGAIDCDSGRIMFWAVGPRREA